MKSRSLKGLNAPSLQWLISLRSHVSISDEPGRPGVAKDRPKRRIRTDFTLGEEAAEFDGLLREAFYETWLYKAIDSKEDKKCFIIGRTGSGKSACFQHLADAHEAHVIRLNPEDLALQYITELGVVKYLSALEVHLDPLFIALWKHVLLIEIIKHRYGVDSYEAKQRFLATLREKIKRDKSKQAALDYLDEFEGKFWHETDERVKEITRNFETQVNAQMGGKISAGFGDLTLGGGDSHKDSIAERAELVNRFQRIVNETQVPRLNKMISVLDDDILDSPQNFTYIVIDDLDRDWADERTTNDLIRCLFRAVYDLKRVQNLKVLVALRTNIFEALDFGRSGGQEEKFRALTYRVQWTADDLEKLLDARMEVAAKRHGLIDIRNAADILPRNNTTMGNPVSYILNRTLMRPRDAIAFMNECLSFANGKDRVTWRSIHSAEAAYSSNRLLALRDEWKPNFPGIEQMFRVFSRAPNTISREEMLELLDNCALLAAERDFPGVTWMTELSAPIWSGSGSDDWAELYQPLIRVLHNIGFIGCITHEEADDADEPAIFNYDEPNFPDHLRKLRSVTDFVVHPAFRPALDIRG